MMNIDASEYKFELQTGWLASRLVSNDDSVGQIGGKKMICTVQSLYYKNGLIRATCFFAEPSITKKGLA